MRIQAVNLTKMYFKGSPNQIHAIKNATIEISENEFCVITGPSGSGKSTFLSLIGLLTRPTSGKIMYDDDEVTTFSDAWRTRIRKDKIGFIFQHYNLLPQFSAWENVALPTLYTNMSKVERKKQAIQAMSDLGLGHRIDFKVAQLSGGEQQRVAIARAIIKNPELIIADEPTASVDEETAGLIIDMFKNFKADGKTVIVSTHDKSLIETGTLHISIKDGEMNLDQRGP